MIKKKIPLPLLSAVLLCLAVLASCAGTGTDAPMYTDGTETEDEGSCTLPDDFRIRDTEPLPETMTPETAAPAAEPITEPITEPVTEALPEPLTFETVTEDYFADALFIGDSCTEGLRLCSKPEGSTFYSGTSMTVFGIMDSRLRVDGCTGLRQLLENRTFGKIYLLLGINEIGYGYDAFVKQYGEVVGELRALQPDAILYLQDIFCVTAEFEQTSAIYAKDNLQKRNEAIASFADGEHVFYLSVNDVLADSRGNLPADHSTDGVHLKAEIYEYWHTYLLEHAIVTGMQKPLTPEE